MIKIFINANIILDFLDNTRICHLISKQLFIILLEKDFEVYFSEDILTTVYYVSKNKKATLTFFKQIIEKWNIIPFNKNVIQQGINISLQKNIDLEDVLQCLCAKENKCDIFITNDKKFYNCDIKIMTSKEFIELFS